MEQTELSLDWTFKLTRVPGVGHPGTELDQPRPAKKSLPVQCAELMSSLNKKPHIPKGLIGSRCTAEIDVVGHKCQCLLDTGSQVTTIPVSFYNDHLSDSPFIHSMNSSMLKVLRARMCHTWDMPKPA